MTVSTSAHTEFYASLAFFDPEPYGLAAEGFLSLDWPRNHNN